MCKFDREILVNLYLTCKDHNTDDFFKNFDLIVCDFIIHPTISNIRDSIKRITTNEIV